MDVDEPSEKERAVELGRLYLSAPIGAGEYSSSSSTPPRLLDPWYPRPLIASRDPVAEEGSFIACCSHAMHATCKAKYARQLKSRVDTLNRYSTQTVFEFKCPICTSVANLDLPVLGSVYQRVSVPWLIVRLVQPTASDGGVEEATGQQGFAIGSWLSSIESWLEAPSTGSLDLSPSMVSLSKFRACLSHLRGSFSGVDPSSSNGTVSMIDSVLARMNDNNHVLGNLFSCETASGNEDSLRSQSGLEGRWSSNSSSDHLRVLFRWCRSSTGRRATTDRPSDATSTGCPAQASSSNAIGQLLLPPPSPPEVVTSLFDVVQRLFRLCRPLSISSLTQATPPLRAARATAGGAAGELATTSIRGAVAREDGRSPEVIDITADWESTRCSRSPLFFVDEIDLFLTSLKVLGRQLVKVQAGVCRGDAVESGQLDAMTNMIDCTLAYLERQARATVLSAAREWRALRHSTAYTLVALEKSIRQASASQHVLDGSLTDCQLNNLRSLLQTSLAAHAQFATVSRCLPAASTHRPLTLCADEADETEQVKRLWDHPTLWWWWSYCAPEPEALSSGSSAALSDTCRLAASPQLVHVAVKTARLAATEDARKLWHLLIPRLDYQDPCGGDLRHASFVSGVADGSQPISLLWEVDIVFLFVSLLHLRPGLEERVAGVACQCQCQRLRQTEKAADGGPDHFLACDEGRPREPIGDAHELHLVRLCYTAVLCQALLSWHPDSSQTTLIHERTPMLSGRKAVDEVPMSDWSSASLLSVWNRLRSLSGLPTLDCLSPDGQGALTQTEIFRLASSLGQHLRTNSLSFLRIAALVMHIITGVEMPKGLGGGDGDSDEHCVLLTYLGLLSGSSDLLVILSSLESSSGLESRAEPAVQSCGASGTDSASTTSAVLSESLWMARLVTSWCLAGRRAASRTLYLHLCQQFLSTPSAHRRQLLPLPDVRLPRLIGLPREYAQLLTLTVDLKYFIGNNMHNDPSVCLVCGHFAYYVCCSCRQCKPTSCRSEASAALESLPTDSMQAHSRRCHSGYSLILCIFACRVILLSDQARRTTQMPTPYRDAFGEVDHELRRGNPLFLVPAEYERLNRLWLNHQSVSGALSDLVITPTI